MSLGSPSSKAADLPSGFVESLIADNLDATVIAESPDGRLFIAEKHGRIRLVQNDSLLRDPFLQLEVDFVNERGLSGLVFHPDFEINNYFYVYYSVPRKSVNRLSRFQANGNYAIPSSEEVIFETEEIGYIHNAGALLFGLDKKLYISIGDLNQPHRAQKLDGLHGKVLRLNDDGTIPKDNPFYNSTSGMHRAIWAIGLRNSFCATIDQNSGAIYAGDVGLDSWEEINRIRSGGNYGWDIGEGPISIDNRPPSYVDPIHYYVNEWQKGCAIGGISAYSPKEVVFPSEYLGNLFFSDYCTGEIRRFDPMTNEYLGVFASGISSALALHTSSDGDLYYIARNADGSGSLADNTSSQRGQVWKISYRGDGAAPFVSKGPSDLTLILGEKSELVVKAFGSDLSYSWYRDSMLIPGEHGSLLQIGPVSLDDNNAQYYCIVENSIGRVASESAVLSVRINTRPQFSIVEPSEAFLYRAGDSLRIKGVGTDHEDGRLDDSLLSWNIELFHDEHSHPFARIQGMADTVLYIPSIGETSANVWYRVTLSGQDHDGFTNFVSRDVFPELVEMRFEAAAPGLFFNLDGEAKPLPHMSYSVWGMQHTVTAPLFQFVGDSLYIFKGWDDHLAEQSFDFLAIRDPYQLQLCFDVAPRSKGTGLLGQYYSDPERDFSGDLVKTQVDRQISYKWLTTSPSGLPEDHFSIRWTGYLEVPITDEYTFYADADDGIRLLIDRRELIKDWTEGDIRPLQATMELQANRRYPIVIEYYEHMGDASCELSWSSSFMQRQLIRANFLYPVLLAPEHVSSGFELYPNPVHDLLQVKILSTETASEIRVHDLTGSLITSRQLEPSLAGEVISVLTADLLPGTYMVTVVFAGGEESLLFVKS